MSIRSCWLLPLLAAGALGVATASEAQNVAQLTLAGSGLPPGPLDVTSLENPMRGTFTHRFTYPLSGLSQIPAGAIISEVRLVQISSGTFGPAIIEAHIRPLISNSIQVMEVVNGGAGPINDFPVASDPLEIYGFGQYVVGGTAVFTTNPFTGQPWTRSDLDTLVTGFWARWINNGGGNLSTQFLSLNDFRVEVVFTGLTLTVAPSRLDASTGDTGRFITTTANPSTVSIAPTISVGAYSNPNSTCTASITFGSSSGVGTVNSAVSASPAGCSRIGDNVRANVGATQSSNFLKMVVPPQIMIKVAKGESGGLGDLEQLAILRTARNRFGDRDFPGGTASTWQDVLVLREFYGAADATTNGPCQRAQKRFGDVCWRGRRHGRWLQMCMDSRQYGVADCAASIAVRHDDFSSGVTRSGLLDGKDKTNCL